MIRMKKFDVLVQSCAFWTGQRIKISITDANCLVKRCSPTSFKGAA